MHRLSPRLLAASYGVATTFLLLVTAGGVVTALLAPSQATALRMWASTNVANMHHHPIPALVLSAFLVSQSPVSWLVMIAFVMFGANRALGNLRLTLVCIAGQVIGTAVSEGIVAYRLDHGRLHPYFAHLSDIGPSYVVVAAIVAGAAFGSWLTRACAIIAFATLVFVGHIFAGLTSLNVPAVGHLTAVVTATTLAVTLLRVPGLALANAARRDRRAANWAGTVSRDSGILPQASIMHADPGIIPQASIMRAELSILPQDSTTCSPQPSQGAASASPEDQE
jgi:hypothetical protein